MSADSKYTATPWRIHSAFPLWIVPEGHEGRSRGGATDDAEDLARFAQDICSLQDCTRHRSEEEVRANARLIVSAVNQREELLEALRNAIEVAYWMSGSDDFAPGGEAHAGWAKAKAELQAAEKLLAEARKAEEGA